jgi:hypothetical protein
MPDAELRRRLAAEPIVLLTNDTEFEDIGLDYAGKVIISSTCFVPVDVDLVRADVSQKMLFRDTFS